MKLLHIDSSILGDNSASRQLSHDVVEAWKAAEADVMVTYRDLAADAISHFSAQTLIAAGTNAERRDAAQKHETDRKSVVSGKSVYEHVDPGGRNRLKKKKNRI